ncbi:MAG TPA: AtpZ/AtpI family protein [Halanaerobiales bacterium]|nr:AtpZ/AtpI family protein [Halanaerobiales bacterium]
MNNNNSWQKIAQAFGMLTLLGITIIVNIAVGFWLGSLVDKLIGSDLIFKIIGLITGVFSGFYSDYKLITDVFGDNDEDK